jgi:hypothetical protein
LKGGSAILNVLPEVAPPSDQETPGERRVLAILKVLYGLGFVVHAVALGAGAVVDGPGQYPALTWICKALWVASFAVVYAGLRSRAPWTIPLVLYGSLYTLIVCVAAPLPTMREAAIVRFGWIAGSIFQLWFFSRFGTRRVLKCEAVVF